MKGIPFIWTKYENFSGADVNILIKEVKEDNKGADITGLAKFVGGDNKGLSLTGEFNYFGKVNEWSVSYATLGNVVKEKGEDSFGLQIGLYNKVGD